MHSLGKIRELDEEIIKLSRAILENDQEKYQAFFKKALTKYGIDSIDDLESDADKEDFFQYVDDNWNSEEEPGTDGEKVDEDDDCYDPHMERLNYVAGRLNESVMENVNHTSDVVNGYVTAFQQDKKAWNTFVNLVEGL